VQEVYDDAIGELAVRKSVGRLQLEPDNRRGARTGESSDLWVFVLLTRGKVTTYVHLAGWLHARVTDLGQMPTHL
jgi:hypothetical protein